MKKYLIDVNLPYHFSFWQEELYIHLRDIDPRMPDRDIWEYAVINNLTIITKDSDFADRIINRNPPPKVIHLKIGNLKLNKLWEFINRHWSIILQTSENCKLVNVYSDRVEGIE